MENPKTYYIEKFFAWLLVVLATYSILVVIFVSISRIHYPYSLERMEGASLIQVARILEHKALYTSPSMSYVPLIYPPVYFYLAALISKILGLGFAALRLVSSLAFAGCLVFIFLMIDKATKDRYSSLIGTGFFAATYPLSGIWFDVARVDTLFVFFCLGAIWFSSKEDSKALFLSGLLWCLTLFTKQTALIALLFSFAYLLLFNFKRNIIRLGWTIVLCILAYLMSSILWGEWFSYYVFYLPTFHQFQQNFKDILNSVFQLVLPLILSILLSLMPFLLARDLRSKEPVCYFGFMTLVLFGLSLMGRLNLGGFTNVYMPAHAMIAVMLGISLNWWKDKFTSVRTLPSSLWMCVLYLLYVFQFSAVYFDPRTVIPNPEQVEEWSRFERFITQFDGDVLTPEINYLAMLADKHPFTNQVALDEILGAYGEAEPIQSDKLREEINQSLQERQFDLVILKNVDEPWIQVTMNYHCFPFSQSNESGFPPVVIQEYQACYPIIEKLESTK
jgi:hypothetical protein